MKRVIYFLIAISIFQSLLFSKTKLEFDKKGKFKIAQITDVHWNNDKKSQQKTLATIEHVLKSEKPDLVVFTGDIACTPVKESWNKIAQSVIDANIPWTHVNGNHDEEYDLKRSEIIEYLQTLHGFVGENGDKDVHGYGNYSLIVNSKKKQDSSILYFFDSNSYPENIEYGTYDWIRLNQVKWYDEQSKQYAKKYKKNLPALSFFHIPLPEYKELLESQDFVGTQNEGVASGDINSGLFNAFIENGDVMGVFVGHDHENDFIGTLYDIALAFGRVTGDNAYGNLERGSRIIELQEGKHEFVTWIWTKSRASQKYFYPDHELHGNAQTQYLPAVTITKSEPGIEYNYYEGNFESAHEIKDAKIEKKGKTENISIENAVQEDHFGFQFLSYIDIPKTGIYQFTVSSDDGGILFIDDKVIVDNDSSHSFIAKSGIIPLEKGCHQFKLLYFEDYGGNDLNVKIKGLNLKKQKIPDAMFFVK